MRLFIIIINTLTSAMSADGPPHGWQGKPEQNAKWWSTKLGEKKVHMIEKVLNLVGQEVMDELFTWAENDFHDRQADSIGGAFMKVIKSLPMPGKNVYDFACEGEENDFEKARKAERTRRRNARNARNRD